jgi:ligand-binding SRPBCC domain-containing protein
MADYVLERRFWVPRSRLEVFELFADVRNLSRMNPPSASLRWLRAPPARIDAGTVLDFSSRLLGIPVRWRVMIREFDPPHNFVDAQLRGPFSRWEHRHRFLEGPAGDGAGPVGTWVEDRVTYRPPLGPLGQLAHALGGRRMIAGIFDYRERRIRELLG